jgi:hypothetical protein
MNGSSLVQPKTYAQAESTVKIAITPISRLRASNLST